MSLRLVLSFCFAFLHEREHDSDDARSANLANNCAILVGSSFNGLAASSLR
jgi:hypothetical protein